MKVALFLLTLFFFPPVSMADTCSFDNKELFKDLDKHINAINSIRELILQSPFPEQINFDAKSSLSKIYSDCLKKLVTTKKVKVSPTYFLENAFHIINDVNFYTFSDQEVMALERIALELNNRDSNKYKPYLLVMEEAFVRARMFAELESFKSMFPSLDYRQPIRLQSNNSSKRSLLTIIGRGVLKKTEPLELRGAQVLVVSHPKCLFSQNARAFIEASAELSTLFSQHSTWIMPQDGNLYIEDVYQVNQESLFPFHYVYKEKEWPEINRWDTPSFYFYKDGELMYSFSGWPQEGNKERLMKGLEVIGLH
jgi:hypothetical protein